MGPNNLWVAWNLEPSILIPLGVTAFVYVWGTGRIWRRAGVGHGITARRCVSFAGSILALLVALVSPLDVLSGQLFSAHMAQHLILMLLAAPLLVMSDFPLALLWAIPRTWANSLGRRLNQSPMLVRAWQVVSSPISAWLLFTVAMWGWHAPAFYEAALRDETIHAIEHFTFLVTAMLFWWVLLGHTGPNHVRYGIAIPFLFTSALQSGVLGALMTFTSQPWYSYYAPLVSRWGLTPLQDQQMAGLLMWIPGGLVFTLLTIGYFAAWLNALEKRSLGLPSRDYLSSRHDQ